MSKNEVIGADYVNLIVGGMYYSLLRSDIEAEEGCYFAGAIKDVWNNSDQPIVIERDGILFQHIHAYIFNRRHRMKHVILKDSLALMMSVRREADYYNFPELVALYDDACQAEVKQWFKQNDFSKLCDCYKMTSPSEILSQLEELISVEVYQDCLIGTLNLSQCKSSMSVNIGVENILWDRLIIDNGENLFHARASSTFNALLDDIREALPAFSGVEHTLSFGYIFAFTENGYSRLPPQGTECTSRFGSVVFIMNSPYTGGVITVSRNGVSQSITKPGEYIMYTNDYSRDISTVISGTLVFAKFDMMRRDEPFSVKVPILYHPLPPQYTLVQAVHSELRLVVSGSNSAGVVLCLSTLYPIVSFDPAGPYLETDPDALTDRDAVLYECLKDTFDVSLVTVCVHRNGGDRKGCIVGPDPATVPACPKIKIIAPFHGFRESFLKQNDKYERWFVTIYTAFYIAAK